MNTMVIETNSDVKLIHLELSTVMFDGENEERNLFYKKEEIAFTVIRILNPFGSMGHS